MDGYAIDKSLLSEEKRQRVCQGLQILQATEYPDAEKALSKIGAVFRNAVEPRWLEVDFSYWGSDNKEKIKISELQQAILGKHVIVFDYFNSELRTSERAVEPLRLVFKSHAWYIAGFCRCREEVRFFRLSRMKRLRILPEVFGRALPPEDEENQISLGDDGNYYVTVQLELNNWTEEARAMLRERAADIVDTYS